MSDSDEGKREWRFYVIDNDIIWSIIQDDIPALLPALQTLREPLQ